MPPYYDWGTSALCAAAACVEVSFVGRINRHRDTLLERKVVR